MPIRWTVARHLTEHAITPYRLADLTGLTVPQCYVLAKDPVVTRIESRTVELLCDVFGCEMADLLRRSDD